MKKLMFAAALVACGGAFADSICAPAEVQVARIYQVQMNVYTTKGVVKTTNVGTICEPGTECLVLRGKDKTVIRGYIYACQALCKLDDYEAGFADSKRKALFGEISEDGEFEPLSSLDVKFLNFMGANFADVETAWDFAGTVKYDEARQQSYSLTGAGYGKRVNGATIYADKMSGYFAGTVTAPFDLKTTTSSSCVCEPSKVLTCDTYASLDYQDSESVAFGAWKMKFNAKDSQAYLSGNWNIVTALRKLMK